MKLLGNKGFAWAVVSKKTGKIFSSLANPNKFLIYNRKAMAESVCGSDGKVIKIEIEEFK